MFIDSNNDGAWQAADEPSDVTDPAGRYALPVAFRSGVTYTVHQAPRAGWRQTAPAAWPPSPARARPARAWTFSTRTGSGALSPSVANAPPQDFGNTQLCMNTGTEFEDLDGRGITSRPPSRCWTASPTPTSSPSTARSAGTGRPALNGDRMTMTLELDPDAPSGVSGAGGGPLLHGDGDGVPGGDFRLAFDFLQGDVTRDGRVTAADLAALRRTFGATSRQPWRYNVFLDANGDGAMGVRDMVLVRTLQGRALPGEAPPPAPAPSPFSSPAAPFAGAPVRRVWDEPSASVLE
jgi:hypothetical protein